MRGSLVPAPGAPWGSGTGSEATMVTVGRALAAVGAIDAPTVEEILTEFDLAVRVRQPSAGGAAGTAAWVVQGPLHPPRGSWPRGPAAWAGPGPRRNRQRGGGRAVRPRRADGPVPGRGHQRRTVPHVVRPDDQGSAVHRGLGRPYPRAADQAGSGELRPDPVRGVHGHRRPRRPVRARRSSPAATPTGGSEISAAPGPAARHPLARRGLPDHPAVRVGLRPPRSRQDPAVPPTAGDKPQVSET